MEFFTVKLQECFSYMGLWLILAIIMLVAALALLVMIIISLIRKGQKAAPAIKELPPETLNMIKNRYLKALGNLQNDVVSGRVDTRMCYQRLSLLVRNYVYDATGLKVQYYTLEDIKKLYMPKLIELVEDYYEPEFAEFASRDLQKAVIHAAEIIRYW